jgi:hypothetical protein
MHESAARLAKMCDEQVVVTDESAAGDFDQCARRLVPSYLHMMNNRLGVSVPEEGYITALVHEALIGNAHLSPHGS